LPWLAVTSIISLKIFYEIISELYLADVFHACLPFLFQFFLLLKRYLIVSTITLPVCYGSADSVQRSASATGLKKCESVLETRQKIAQQRFNGYKNSFIRFKSGWLKLPLSAMVSNCR
jgi:hypothetical protein